MKQLVSVLFALVCCTAPCHAQFGALSRIYSAAKTAKQMKKAKEKASEDQGNKKVKDVIAEKTESEEYKKAMEELQQRLNNDPEYQKLQELKNDSVAAKKYFEEKYGGEIPIPNLDNKSIRMPITKP